MQENQSKRDCETNHEDDGCEKFAIRFDPRLPDDTCCVVGLEIDGCQKLGGAFVGSGKTLRSAILDLLDAMDRTYPQWFGGHSSIHDSQSS